MKAVMLEVPEDLLEDRRCKGIDKFDEMWEGVLHMVPPASGPHQRFASNLHLVLGPRSRDLGLVSALESGLFRETKDYRVPDLVFARPEHCTQRGFDGDVPLVIELLSPDDESRAKLGWYGLMGVAEALLIDPVSRKVELFANRDGEMQPVAAGADGVDVSTLGVRLATVEGMAGEVGNGAAEPGPRLRITWEGGQAEI